MGSIADFLYDTKKWKTATTKAGPPAPAVKYSTARTKTSSTAKATPPLTAAQAIAEVVARQAAGKKTSVVTPAEAGQAYGQSLENIGQGVWDGLKPAPVVKAAAPRPVANAQRPARGASIAPTRAGTLMGNAIMKAARTAAAPTIATPTAPLQGQGLLGGDRRMEVAAQAAAPTATAGSVFDPAVTQAAMAAQTAGGMGGATRPQFDLTTPQGRADYSAGLAQVPQDSTEFTGKYDEQAAQFAAALAARKEESLALFKQEQDKLQSLLDQINGRTQAAMAGQANAISSALGNAQSTIGSAQAQAQANLPIAQSVAAPTNGDALAQAAAAALAAGGGGTLTPEMLANIGTLATDSANANGQRANAANTRWGTEEQNKYGDSFASKFAQSFQAQQGNQNDILFKGNAGQLDNLNGRTDALGKFYSANQNGAETVGKIYDALTGRENDATNIATDAATSLANQASKNSTTVQTNTDDNLAAYDRAILNGDNAMARAILQQSGAMDRSQLAAQAAMDRTVYKQQNPTPSQAAAAKPQFVQGAKYAVTLPTRQRGFVQQVAAQAKAASKDPQFKGVPEWKLAEQIAEAQGWGKLNPKVMKQHFSNYYNGTTITPKGSAVQATASVNSTGKAGRDKDGVNSYVRPLFSAASKQWAIKNSGIWGDKAHQARKSDHNQGNAIDLEMNNPKDGPAIVQWALKQPGVRQVIYGKKPADVYYPDGRISRGGSKYDHSTHVHVGFKA